MKDFFASKEAIYAYDEVCRDIKKVKISLDMIWDEQIELLQKIQQ